jgi:hypothetical protein
MDRTTTEEIVLHSDSAAARVPIEKKGAANASESFVYILIRPRGPAGGLKGKGARRQRLSVRVGAMVAELSAWKRLSST